MQTNNETNYHGHEVAIVGLSGRFPGAGCVSQFRDNLIHGVDSVTRFSDEQLTQAGVSRNEIDLPNYVKAKPLLTDVDLFDNTFFEMSPHDAEILDPQQRLFLECAWKAFEDAAYVPSKFKGRIGVFAGVDMNTYMINNILGGGVSDVLQMITSGDKDYLATRVSYKLDLHGPAVSVQTACSTGLVAIHMGCESILNGESDLVLAGAVAVSVPNEAGYTAPEGSVLSPDGVCRPFDSGANGTVFGNGVGVVILKRLSAAIEDGDDIYAVIGGSAINNDGARKMSYTAPSLEGQALVITEAQQVARVKPEQISYIEAHGTGTSMGDPIEVAALTKAFDRGRKAGNGSIGTRQYCGLGSVKSNFGHLSTAAGVASFIKAVLSLNHRELYPTIHLDSPNEQIDFASSPFYVNTDYTPWDRFQDKRRCGVSSFGMGGTNAHVVLEEYHREEAPADTSTSQVICLSAKTASALENNMKSLVRHLKQNPDTRLCDLAYTLQVGRADFNLRRFFICDSVENLCTQLSMTPISPPVSQPAKKAKPVVFAFSGQGAQYPHMAKELYQQCTVFRNAVEECVPALQAALGFDFVNQLFSTDADLSEFDINHTQHAQPALFVVEYALAKSLMARGAMPDALIGHSIGELTAACVAGVFAVDDAVSLVCERGRLMQNCPDGEMLGVSASAESIQPILVEGVSLAAYNGASLCSVGGGGEEIAQFKEILNTQGIEWRALVTSHAFHTPAMANATATFREAVQAKKLHVPMIRFISNLTGTWITDEQAQSADYWASLITQPVKFVQGVSTMAEDNDYVYIEVGPGSTLKTLINNCYLAKGDKCRRITTSLPAANLGSSSIESLMVGLAEMWQLGASIDWSALQLKKQSRRIHIPGYEFDRRQFWIRSTPLKAAVSGSDVQAVRETLYDRPEIDVEQILPNTATEKQLASIWSETLAIKNIGIDDSYFDLGGNSLLAPKFAQSVSRAFDINFSIENMFEYTTIRQQALYVDDKRLKGAEEHGEVAGYITKEELLSEADLSFSEPMPSLDASYDVSAPNVVLLTGAAGFLGSYMLAELLATTNAKVVCVVRSENDEEAFNRIRRALTKRLLWRSDAGERIVAMAGDTGQPYLGIGEDRFARLATDVDAIYHCAAWVNFTYPYTVLKPANVDSTKTLLELATTKRLKPVHLVSTLAVFGLDVNERNGLLSESHDIDAAGPIIGGYSQSKWVSEKLGLVARSKGVPVSIYRVGTLGGHSRTGDINTSDYVWKVIKSCIQLGKIPEIDEMALDVTPVDYVAKSIIAISLMKDEQNTVSHFFNPNPYDWSELADWAVSRGYCFETVNYEDWSGSLIKSFETNDDNALFPFMSLFTNLGDSDEHMESAHTFEIPGRYACEATLKRLHQTGLQCDKVDEDLVSIYFNHLINSGYLPPPQNETLSVS